MRASLYFLLVLVHHMCKRVSARVRSTQPRQACTAVRAASDSLAILCVPYIRFYTGRAAALNAFTIYIFLSGCKSYAEFRDDSRTRARFVCVSVDTI